MSPPTPPACRAQDEYTNEELLSASNAFALIMLRIRDNKTKGVKDRGVLKQLATEIISTSKVEGGVCDDVSTRKL